MACLFNDNVYTKVFTPREYQVELLDTLKERNTIVCLGNNSTKLFLSIKLVQELAGQVRSKSHKRSIFVLDEKYISLISSYIKHLTDLNVAEITDVNKVQNEDWSSFIEDKQIIVLTSNVCLYCVTHQLIQLENINLLVIDDCRLALKENSLSQLLKKLNISDKNGNCRVLGFTTITLNQQCEPARLKAEFEYLENLFDSSVDTSSDIVTVLRYCSKPQERIVVCKNPETCDLAEKLEKCVIEAREFLEDHRYDPFEIYEEEFADELQRVPDPKLDPMGMIQDFLDTLHTLGPWCADKAAFALLIKIEHLKVKTPYERHYLLLAMLSTVFIRIRAICDDEFQKYSDHEAILSNCTPRILRLIEILKTFKPPNSHNEKNRSTKEKDAKEIKEVKESTEVKEIKEVKENTKVKEIKEVKENTEVKDVEETKGTTEETKTQPETKTETPEVVPNPNNYKHPRAGGRNWRNRNSKGPRREGGSLKSRMNQNLDQESLCAIVFVQNRFTAKILFHLINELSRNADDFSYLSVQYTVEKITDPISGGREAENEHRKQEEVLKKFRMHECNLLVATSVLEEGIDLPKCNLVVRFDQPLTYNSYVQSKGRAKMSKAYYILMSEQSQLPQLIDQMARYREIEKMLVTKCNNNETTDIEEQEADMYTNLIEPYVTCEGATVNMSTAIALVNKYCAKLPSDTFTRLTAMWSMSKVVNSETMYPMYSCSIRLPINSPLKQTIKGVLMPSKVLAKRIAALEVCKLLHKMGELDDHLMPVGKETFKAFEEDWNCFPMEETDELLTKNNMEPRPGTTKRRQYYYKRIADSLTSCRPLPNQPVYLYLINMNLTCPLPEEQNTRGRKIYPPEDSPQGFGILTSKHVPTICPFPIFTRSGEVQVSFELADSSITLTEEQLDKIIVFLNYVFTNVLRLQKYLMVFEPDSSENNYFIVPTIKNGAITEVDWNFLNVIYKNRDLMPRVVEEENRKDFQFDSEKYHDAVVMPWYRNQDQPQYFYVAEVCTHLNPKSSFPGTDYKTFEEYYFKKYNIQIQNLQQPLLDVDHTSARLNFLTPRYVNRKGVALPTSSEETKRAKRENLEQKQILVPELCTIHPFPASLWRKAVCLPCILYRLNALLLADQIRKQVAEELALGQIDLPYDFQWEPLNFGWSLSDVLKKSRESKMAMEAKQIETNPEETKAEPLEENKEEIKEEIEVVNEKGDAKEAKEEKKKKEEGDEEDIEEIDMTNTQEGENWIEIGTWSNEMAKFSGDRNGTDNFSGDGKGKNKMNSFRYGSPTSWMQNACNDYYDYDTDSDDSYISDDDNSESSNKSCGIRIEFKGDNTAEAIDMDDEKRKVKYPQICAPEYDSVDSDQENAVGVNIDIAIEEHNTSYAQAVERNKEDILSGGVIISTDEKFEQMKFQEDKGVINEEFTKIINVSLNMCDNVVLKEYQEEDSDVLLHSNSFSDMEKTDSFSFDFQPDLSNHSGPSPSVILQALTMSNANDGINLERLETIGDSFLKYAITNYLYSTYENIHEGKLSHLRSKQVSNLNLYRLGRAKVLGESMIATKFDPHDNWLPPCYYVPRELEQALIDGKGFYDYQDFKAEKSKPNGPQKEITEKESPSEEIKENGTDKPVDEIDEYEPKENKEKLVTEISTKTLEKEFFGQNIKIVDYTTMHSQYSNDNVSCFIPYNLITQHSIPDKSIADCVEALIGAYLIDCGPRGALLFMAWLGIRVLPKSTVPITDLTERPVGSLKPSYNEETKEHTQVRFGQLSCPKSPLLKYSPDAENTLEILLDGYTRFEACIGYKFRDRSYLLQAMTHASYSPNTVTDCYQRLEFLGDAVLDFLITRHLYNDPRLHSPGALTDLRSALVNNTIFASLAVRHGFHKYFRHLSPGLHEVVNRFVQIQEENGHSISEEYYLIKEDEGEEIEDVEVPKALGDVFESVAGAIFCDSGMSLDAVWRVYYKMMQNEIEQFSTSVPKSPIRELLELEPETAKFGKPEKLADGRRVRVTVEVFGKGTYKGIGRNYRIAKCTAAKCALKQLKRRGMLVRKN